MYCVFKFPPFVPACISCYRWVLTICLIYFHLIKQSFSCTLNSSLVRWLWEIVDTHFSVLHMLQKQHFEILQSLRQRISVSSFLPQQLLFICYKSANVNQFQSANVNQCQSANVNQCQSANVNQCQSANVSQCQSANISQYHSANVNQSHSANVNQCQ